MKVTGWNLFILQTLYRAPERRGDVVHILADKGISLENAQAVGRALEKLGLIDYTESRMYGDAELNKFGIEYMKKNG